MLNVNTLSTQTQQFHGNNLQWCSVVHGSSSRWNVSCKCNERKLILSWQWPIWLMWPAKSLRLERWSLCELIILVSQCFFLGTIYNVQFSPTNSWGLCKVNKLKWVHRTIYWGGRCEVLVVNHEIFRVWYPWVKGGDLLRSFRSSFCEKKNESIRHHQHLKTRSITSLGFFFPKGTGGQHGINWSYRHKQYWVLWKINKLYLTSFFFQNARV